MNQTKECHAVAFREEINLLPCKVTVIELFHQKPSCWIVWEELIKLKTRTDKIKVLSDIIFCSIIRIHVNTMTSSVHPTEEYITKNPMGEG